jgi:hypothetical protein
MKEYIEEYLKKKIKEIEDGEKEAREEIDCCNKQICEYRKEIHKVNERFLNYIQKEEEKINDINKKLAEMQEMRIEFQEGIELNRQMEEKLIKLKGKLK